MTIKSFRDIHMECGPLAAVSAMESFQNTFKNFKYTKGVNEEVDKAIYRLVQLLCAERYHRGTKPQKWETDINEAAVVICKMSNWQLVKHPDYEPPKNDEEFESFLLHSNGLLKEARDCIKVAIKEIPVLSRLDFIDEIIRLQDLVINKGEGFEEVLRSMKDPILKYYK